MLNLEPITQLGPHSYIGSYESGKHRKSTKGLLENRLIDKKKRIDKLSESSVSPFTVRIDSLYSNSINSEWVDVDDISDVHFLEEELGCMSEEEEEKEESIISKDVKYRIPGSDYIPPAPCYYVGHISDSESDNSCEEEEEEVILGFPKEQYLYFTDFRYMTFAGEENKAEEGEDSEEDQQDKLDEFNDCFEKEEEETDFETKEEKGVKKDLNAFEDLETYEEYLLSKMGPLDSSYLLTNEEYITLLKLDTEGKHTLPIFPEGYCDWCRVFGCSSPLSEYSDLYCDRHVPEKIVSISKNPYAHIFPFEEEAKEEDGEFIGESLCSRHYPLKSSMGWFRKEAKEIRNLYHTKCRAYSCENLIFSKNLLLCKKHYNL